MTARSMARTWGLTVVIVGAAIVLVEGVSSLVVFAGRLATEQERAPSGDRAHIQYDSALGWTGKPGVTLRDFYGPGLSVQTNAQGFRDTVDFTRAAPPGRSRVICSGDSFTFGYGVGNDQSWCALLPVLDSRLPALNLGLVGYGVDQSYLLYRRVGNVYGHRVVCFAFITDDFLRMQRTSFLGNGKPRLVLHGGTLTIENVPVPRPRPAPRWIARTGEAVAELRTAQLLAAIRHQLSRRSPATSSEMDPAAWSVAEHVFGDLQALTAANGATLLLIYLPTIEDYAGHGADWWRGHVREAARQHGWSYLDLVDAMRSLPADSVGALFLPPGQHPLRSPRLGHLSAAGHRWFARRVSARLAASPSNVARLP